MAVVWKLERRGIRYEVRSAGRTLRLYTGDAFHTQYNPARPLPGGVWDLLALPALVSTEPVRPRSRALVLGVGGGAVLRVLNDIGMNAVTGVELDPVHVQVARRFFGCDRPGIELVTADATRWVASSRRRFDLVIDDLFVDGSNDPERPPGLGPNWTARLAKRVAAGGMLVINHLSLAGARATAAQQSNRAAGFTSAIVFQRPHYENAVLALFRQKVIARTARKQILDRLPGLGPGAARNLEFSCRQLF